MNRRGTTIALWGAAIIAVVAIVVGPVFGYMVVVIPFVVGAVVGSVVGGMAVAAGHSKESYLGGATSDAVVGWQEFHRELARSRRFGRAFGLVRFPGANVAEAPTAHLRDRIAARARRNDRVWIDGSDLFLLLPEADSDAVGAAVARTQLHAAGALGNGVAAVFPASGITSGALIASLYGEQAAPVAIGSWAPVVATISHPDDADSDMAETAT
jgi:MFS family permease